MIKPFIFLFALTSCGHCAEKPSRLAEAQRECAGQWVTEFDELGYPTRYACIVPAGREAHTFHGDTK